MNKRSYFFHFALLCCFVFNPLFAYEDKENVDVQLLAEAWTIPTGGSNNQPYYSLNVNGLFFYGERSWEDRWNFIKDQINCKNKRILELGCNVGIASVYLLKYGQALCCTGVDRPNDVLALHGMPRLMEASKLLQRAFHVHVDLVQLDFNKDDYEELIGQKYDFVVCMSLLKWVEDKERFLNYLALFDEVLFEGHESDSVEIERFKRHGFDHYQILGSTHVGVSYPQDSKRTLIYFWKSKKTRLD